MISYMPFTAIDEHLLESLAAVMGVITLYSPAPALVPDHMKAPDNRARLDIRYPEGVDEQLLLSAIGEYNTWAQLHQDHIGDLAGFFKFQQGRFPLVDETNPTQIGDQIRHFGESRPDDDAGDLFRAALFLAMAQEFDEQHRAMARDLKAVQAMEQRMMGRLSGQDMEPEDRILPSGTLPAGHDPLHDEAYMVSQRVKCWARVALSQPPLPLLYVTASRQAVEHVTDLFAGNVLGCTPDFDMASDTLPISEIFRAAVKNAASEPAPRQADPAARTDAIIKKGDLTIEIYKLVDIPPQRFLERLAGHAAAGAGEALPGNGSRHTLVGRLDAQGSGF